MKITTKLKIAAWVPAFVALIIGFALIFSYKVLEHTQKKSSVARHIITSMYELNNFARSYMLHPDERPKKQFLLEYDSITRLVTSFRSGSSEQQQDLETIQHSLESVRNTFFKLVSNYEHPDSRENAALLQEAEERLAGQILTKSREGVSQALDLKGLIDAEIAKTQARINTLILVLIASTTLPLTIILMRMMTNIAASLATLRKGTEYVAAGNLDHPIGLSRRDEIGELAGAFDLMAQRLRDTTVSRDALTKEVQERKRAEDALKRVRDELEHKVRERTADLKSTVQDLSTEVEARRKAELQLRQWSRVFMDSTDPIVIEDSSGHIIDLNEAAESAYCWKRSDLIGKHIKTLIPQESYSLADELRKRCRNGQTVRNWEGMRQDQFGRTYPVLLTAFQMANEFGEPSSLATIAKDISELKEAELRLRRSELRLQELSRKSIEALEVDRQTVSRELHDSIGGSLAAIKHGLEGITEEMARNPDGNVSSLEKFISHLVDTIKETKRIAANLRPLTLDDLGLIATIGWYIRQFEEHYRGICIIHDISISEDEVPDALKIVIYRVLQEALSNAARHSEADTVHIRLKNDGSRLDLEVQDDGRGFDVEKVAEREGVSSGYGLQSMRERAEICNGDFFVNSELGKGTLIKVVLPLRHETSAIEALR
jgi:PAS domain S-box-containing protein